MAINEQVWQVTQNLFLNKQQVKMFVQIRVCSNVLAVMTSVTSPHLNQYSFLTTKSSYNWSTASIFYKIKAI